MRVTVQLPRYFLITGNLRIEVTDLAPVNERSSLARRRIETPVDRIAKAQVVKAKQIETASDRSLGALEQCTAIIGKAALDD